MMCFESMLITAAQKAGMKVPPDKLLDKNEEESFKKEEYPHFFIYCRLQLGRPIVWGEHWENAEIIAKVPEEKLMKMTLEDFLVLGISWPQ